MTPDSLLRDWTYLSAYQTSSPIFGMFVHELLQLMSKPC
jgi:hypothetical protein